jgi:hypothetical protein
MLTMFDSLKAISRRVVGAFLTVVGAVFGQWHPPFWLRAIGRGLANLGNKARAYPRQAGAGVLGLVLLAAAAFYGWHWYTHLPQPHTVGYSLHKPNLTDYTQQPPVVDNLQVRFAESVAPLAAIGKPVTEGISSNPRGGPGAGPMIAAWCCAGKRLAHRRPLHPRSGEEKPARRRRVAQPVQQPVLHPAVPRQPGAERAVPGPVQPNAETTGGDLPFFPPGRRRKPAQARIGRLGKGLAYRDAQLHNRPEITFDDTRLNAYVRSAALATPLESTPVSAKLDEGIKARDGGNASNAPLVAEVTVPGRYRLTFTAAQVSFVDNERGEPEPVLMFSSSSAVADDTIAGKVQAWLLPEKAEDDTRPYNSNDIDDALLARSTKVNLTHVPSVEPLNTLHAFKFKAPAGRALYVRVPANLEAIGGYLAKNPPRP